MISEIFASCGWWRKNGKPLSAQSRTDYGKRIVSSYVDLKNLGYHLQKPWNLEGRHIEALCAHWAAKGNGASIVQNKLSALSWFGAVMGKPGLVGPTHGYDYHGKSMARHSAAEHDKSPEGAGYSRNEVVQRAMAEDATFGHIVLLQLALGLRDKEAIRAKVSSADQGDHWRLPSGSGGSKGGRGRSIPLTQGPWQREAIDQVKAFVARRGKRHDKCSLGWSLRKKVMSESGRKADGLKSDLRRYLRHAKNSGFTKQALGFTGHGMRHSFAHHQLNVHGYVAPVKVIDGQRGLIRDAKTQQPVTSVDREAVQLAALRTSQSLGHARTQITAAYYGRIRFAQPSKDHLLSPTNEL